MMADKTARPGNENFRLVCRDYSSSAMNVKSFCKPNACLYILRLRRLAYLSMPYSNSPKGIKAGFAVPSLIDTSFGTFQRPTSCLLRNQAHVVPKEKLSINQGIQSFCDYLLHALLVNAKRLEIEFNRQIVFAYYITCDNLEA